MNLFKVDGNLSIDTSNVYIDGKNTDLSICKMSSSDYYQLVKEDRCLSNVLYVISSDIINAYGQQIKNVGLPELSSDAATKGYVDNVVQALSGDVQTLTREEVEQIAKDVFKSSLQSILSTI